MSNAHNKAMRARWVDRMKDTDITTVFDNDTSPTTGLWARFSIRNADSQQVDISSSPRTRTVGVIIVQLF